MEAKREIYAEVLRIVAAFTVVFQHTVTSAWYLVPVDSDIFLPLNFLNSLVRFGVGIFIMISGAFMLSPRYPHPPRKILTKNLPRILILLVAWVIVYGIVNAICISVKNDTGIGESILNILATPLNLFTKPPTHLWFLYTIAGLYALTPMLRVFTVNASRRMQLYAICIFFIFGLIWPTAEHILSKFTNIELYKNLGIPNCTSFIGFYLTGYYLSNFEPKPILRKILYASAVLSWVVSFALSTSLSLSSNHPNEYFFGNFRPTTFLMAAGVFCFFRTRYKDKLTSDARLLNISKCMLGVYLLHPLLIKSFYGLKLTLLLPLPLITIPLIATLIFSLSLGAVYLFRSIPGVRKIL